MHQICSVELPRLAQAVPCDALAGLSRAWRSCRLRRVVLVLVQQEQRKIEGHRRTMANDGKY